LYDDLHLPDGREVVRDRPGLASSRRVPIGYPFAQPPLLPGFTNGIPNVTKSAAVFITLVLLVSSLGARAQESEVLTVPQAVEEFGSVLEDEGLTLVVIHLHDRSVEALFLTAPNMQVLREQAKQATMFFVQGTNGTSETLAPSLEWQVRHGDAVIGTRPVNIENFEENSEVPHGERYSGFVVSESLIDHRTEFVVEKRGAQLDSRFFFDSDRDNRRQLKLVGRSAQVSQVALPPTP
jgi:hypothetical protein